jgi:uncharacterized protein YcgI (DUF1989 family)
MDVCHEIIVPPMSAKAFSVTSGQTVRVIDIHGRQPGDFVAFKSADLAVKLSQARTRVENHKVAVTQGDNLWTNTFPPEIMFTITRDTHGGHDLLYPPCCRYALEKRFGVSRDGCLENLAKALNAWSVKPYEVPDPLNLFFSVSVYDGGRMEVRAPMSKPGSWIDLIAKMDCIVAVATCAVPFPGNANTDYRIKVFET